MKNCRLLLASALLLLIAAAASASEKTVLTVWGLAITPDDKGTDDVVRAFEAANPDIEVRLLGMGAGAMNPQKLMTAIVGGVPPDIVKQDRFTLSDWAHRNAFRSLDDLIERDRNDPDCPTAEKYYESAWAETQYEGHTYGIPIGADNRVLFYNKEIFRQKAKELRAAGLDPDRPPRTWSEILAYSEVLTEFNADGTLKQAGFMPNFGNSWLYLYAFQNNANFLSADGRTCTLNSPEVVEALDFMTAGYDVLGGKANADRFQSTFQSSENDPFLIGKVAMIINGDWVLHTYFTYGPNLDFGTSPAPVPDDRYHKRGRFADEEDTFVTWAGGWSYAIPRGAEHVEEAWRFIKFITSFEGRKINMLGQQDLEQSRGRRFIPGMQAHIRSNEWCIEQFAQGDTPFDDALKLHVEMMKYAEYRPATFAAQVLWDAHVRATDKAVAHYASSEEALAEAEGSVQRVLDEVYETENYPEINLLVPGIIGGGIGLLAVLVGFVLIRRLKMGALARNETKWGYLFISPWVIGFLIFIIGPMVASLFFSFTQYGVLTEARWVGMKNYHDLFTIDRHLMIKAFLNVAYIAGIGVPVSLAAGLGVALLLNTNVRGMRIYRTIYYMPAVVPTVATVILFIWLLNADPSRGIVNSIWNSTISQWFGSVAPGWLTEESWTKKALILMGLWGVGSGMILWLAGLKGVPQTLYEAAGIDGASPRQQFWKITVPQLSPLIFFNTVMGFIGALQIFDQVYVITRGENAGPNDSMLTPVLYLFDNGFKYFRMGPASAIAWVIFVVIILITFGQFKLAPRWVHYEVEK